MTALLEQALAQVKQLSETEQDAVAAQLLRTLVEFDQGKQQSEKPRPQFGSAIGMFSLSPDFDDPIEDFED